MRDVFGGESLIDPCGTPQNFLGSIRNQYGALFCEVGVTLYREEQDVMPLGKRNFLITPASTAVPWALG
jgi:hypothetical protein